MKRILCLILALLMSLMLLACSSRVVSSGLKPLEGDASEDSGGESAQTDAGDTVTPAPTDTPEPTATPEPTPAPTPTPAPVTQDVQLNKAVFNSSGITVSVVQLTYAVNYEVGITYEINNTASYEVNLALYFNSANCWSLWQAANDDPYDNEDQESNERYDSVIQVPAQQIQTVTVYYPMYHPTVAMMGITQIDHFSVIIEAENNDEGKWIGYRDTYVEVTGAAEPDCAYLTGDLLYESAAFTATSLGYDADRQEAYVYVAYPSRASGAWIDMIPIVNGYAFSDETAGIDLIYCKQAILTLDLAGCLELLGVEAPAKLAAGIVYAKGPVDPFVAEIPIPAPASDPGDAARGDVVAETNDLIVRFDGLLPAGDDDNSLVVVLDIENLSEKETFLISAKDHIVTINGTDYNCPVYATLLPGVTTKMYLRVESDSGEKAEWESGSLSFTLDYSPFVRSGGYYSGARYSDLITLTKP